MSFYLKTSKQQLWKSVNKTFVCFFLVVLVLEGFNHRFSLRYHCITVARCHKWSHGAWHFVLRDMPSRAKLLVNGTAWHHWWTDKSAHMTTGSVTRVSQSCSKTVWGKRSGREGLANACSLLLTSFGLLALPGLFLLARHHSKTVRLL